jgi:hypothetical protein
MKGCQWIGDQTTVPYHYCGKDTVKDRSYCEEHVWSVYQKGTAVKRKKDTRRAELVWDFQSAFNEAVQELEEEGYDFSLERWEAEEIPIT